MVNIKVTDQQLLACHDANMSLAEAARTLDVSQACIYRRAQKLELVFANKRGQRRKRPAFSCRTCKERKLCLLCHRLHVSALPCEAALSPPFRDIVEGDPCRWPKYFLRLRQSPLGDFDRLGYNEAACATPYHTDAQENKT